LGSVVKTVRIDMNVTGAETVKAKLDTITAYAVERAKSFPEFAAKINIAAAQEKLAVFRADMKATVAAVAKPVDVQVITKKAQAALADLDAKALKLKATWPDYKITIDDKLAKAKMDLLAVESKIVGDKISKNLSGGGMVSKIGGMFPGGGSGAGSILTGAGSSVAGLPWPAIAGITAAAAAAIPVLASLATVAVGAGAGLGAFAAVGAGAYGKLTSDISALHTANENFQQSALNVDTALKASALDTKIYNAALKAMPPGMAAAAKLLGDQNVRWQDLSISQQNNVVALANNAAAVKSLLPSQKTALTALIAGKKAWDDMSPGQQRAAANMNKISDAWSKLTTAMEPSVLAVIAQAAGLVTKAIGPIGTIAAEAVPGIKQMVGILGGSFITFLKNIEPLIGPSMGALNSILVSVTGSLNKGLAPAMTAGLPNFVKLATFTGKATAAIIDLTGALFRVSSWMIGAGAVQLHDLAVAIDGVRVISIRAFRVASDTFLGLVRTMLGGLLTISTTLGHAIGPFGAPWRAMSAELRTAIGWVGGLKKSVDGLPARKFVDVQVIGSGAGKIVYSQKINNIVGPGGYLEFHSKGARIPGFGGGDRHPALLEGGEAVVPKHLTPAVAPFLKAHGVPGFAAGGLIGPGGVTITGQPWMAGVEGRFGAAAAQSATNQMIAAFRSAAAAAASTGAGMGGAGVARWGPLILQVLAMLRQSSANLGAVEHRMAQESGGNPRAINLTDINARMGDPSRGLMQTIGSTFAKYRSFSLPNDIYNPEANIFAGLNYALNAYAGRSLSSVMMQAGGYDQGGYLPTGLSLAYNGTGRPEPVGHGGGGIHLHGDIHVSMPFGSTAAEVRNGLVKALDELSRARRLPQPR
jgi:SLT domain-containing protein